MATINEIKQQAEAVKNATQVGENTAERVGGALASLADIAEQQDSKLSDLSIKSERGLSGIELSIDDTSKYINSGGNLSQGGEGYMANNTIVLNSNETLYFYAKGYGTNVSMISRKNDDGTYQALCLSTDNDYHLYEFTNYSDVPMNLVLSFVGKDSFGKIFAYITNKAYTGIGYFNFAGIRNTLRRTTTQKARGIKYMEVYFEPVANEPRKIILVTAGYFAEQKKVHFLFREESRVLTTNLFGVNYAADEPPTGTQVVVINDPSKGAFLKAVVDFDVLTEYTDVNININTLPYSNISKNNPDYVSRIVDTEIADYVSTQSAGAYVGTNGTVINGGNAVYTKPILLKSRETISAYCRSYNKYMCIISEVLKEDESYKTLTNGTGNEAQRYTYTNNTGHDIYIALSSVNDIEIKAIAIFNKSEVEEVKTELDFNSMQTLKPFHPVIDTARFAGIIHQWAFIGDSLNSGCVVAYNNSGRVGIDNYEWSWGQVICRLCGTQGTNFSKGGLMASTWWDTYINKEGTGYHTGGSNEKFTDRKFNAYTICLGTNECNKSYNIGSMDDVDLSNYNNNKESFYGYYCKIIQYIKEINPSAKVFLITIPDIYHSLAESYGVNTAIRAIANKFDNCFLVDLYKYIPANRTLEDKYKFWGHLTAAGYQWMGYVMANLFSYIIENNLASFKNVPFIGTQYDDGNIT